MVLMFQSKFEPNLTNTDVSEPPYLVQAVLHRARHKGHGDQEISLSVPLSYMLAINDVMAVSRPTRARTHSDTSKYTLHKF